MLYMVDLDPLFKVTDLEAVNLFLLLLCFWTMTPDRMEFILVSTNDPSLTLLPLLIPHMHSWIFLIFASLPDRVCVEGDSVKTKSYG